MPSMQSYFCNSKSGYLSPYMPSYIGLLKALPVEQSFTKIFMVLCAAEKLMTHLTQLVRRTLLNKSILRVDFSGLQDCSQGKVRRTT